MDELTKALADTLVLMWAGVGALAGWLLSAIVTHLFLRSGYPPNVARFGCWLGLSSWLAYFVFFVLGYVAGIALPAWLLIVLAVVVIVLAVFFMVLARRRLE